MSLKLLKRLAVKISSKQDSLFNYSVEKQKSYIKKFPEPRDNFERSYFQFCCQMKLNGTVMHITQNVVALPLSLFYIIKYKRRTDNIFQKSDAVFFYGGKPENIIPDSLRKRFSNIALYGEGDGNLKKQDIKFLRKLFKRYPFSWMLWLKCILKVAQYSKAIRETNPKAIISCDEFSFTSSVLTEYCHTKNVQLINVMHGEKLYYIRDSFFKYDEFYVWNKKYADLLISLRAEKSQFRIEAPESLLIKQNNRINKIYDYVYYLGNENEEQIKEISKVFFALNKNGIKTAIRPHPRYSDMSIINREFSFTDIEDTADVSIEESVLRTKAAVSIYSTVLNQAYHSGVKVVIDDITNRQRYTKLKELGYVMLSVEHKKLSDILEESK